MMKCYEKYLFIFFITVGIMAIVIHPFFFFLNLGYPSEEERTVDEWWKKKEKYARSITGKKLLIVSGSNTLFAVDSEKIEQELKIPTVNFGVHAGLDFYILHRVMKNLQAGDIVVLPLEYRMYECKKYVFQTEYIKYITAYDKEAFQSLSILEKISLIYQWNTFDLIKGAINRAFPPPRRDGIYSSKYLNKNGDMMNNLKKNSFSIERLQSGIPQKVFSSYPIPSKEAQDELFQFISFCHEHDVQIYAAWPTFFWKTKHFQGQDAEAIKNILRFYQESEVDILGNYKDCLYEGELFYDSRYHLNDLGKAQHTDYLIELLKTKV